MSNITRFQDLECWKTSRKLSVAIYQLSGDLEKDFGLRNQFRRASVSIMNNIAEGFSRFSNKEKVRFLEIAQSSASEVQSMLYLIEALNYLSKDKLEALHSLVEKNKRQTWGLIKYLRSL